MAEPKQRSRFLFRLQLSDELDEQVDRALDLVAANIAVKPVTATLGNPVAFPLIAGGIGVLVGALILRGLFDGDDPIADVERAAQGIADWLSRFAQDAAKATEEGLRAISNGIRDGIMELWRRFTEDPLFGFGGKEIDEPFDPLGPP